jgi:Asp-tRNA(Asn)/Glu-tRNA(Gln) amidotransferase A subunit family amidase
LGQLDSLPFLFGIPVSIKDFFNMRGSRATIGTTYLTQKRDENAAALEPII